MVQGAFYGYALYGCDASNLVHYNFPGGGNSALGSADYNLVPELSLVIEQPPRFFGQQFAVLPSNEASTPNGAATGFFFKTWGPIFNTYTYQDINGQTTFYMRRNLFRLGMSHRIERCDGKKPSIWIEEGSDWFGNKVRGALGYIEAKRFKVYIGDEQMGCIKETDIGTFSLTFCEYKHSTGKECHEIGSGVLKNRHYNMHYDEWLVTNKNSTELPYWATVGATTLFGYSQARNEHGHHHHIHHHHHHVLEAIEADNSTDEADNSTEIVKMTAI